MQSHHAWAAHPPSLACIQRGIASAPVHAQHTRVPRALTAWVLCHLCSQHNHRADAATAPRSRACAGHCAATAAPAEGSICSAAASGLNSGVSINARKRPAVRARSPACAALLRPRLSKSASRSICTLWWSQSTSRPICTFWWCQSAVEQVRLSVDLRALSESVRLSVDLRALVG